VPLPALEMPSTYHDSSSEPRRRAETAQFEVTRGRVVPYERATHRKLG